MSANPNDADFKRELQATLEARRELGPDFDQHFLDRLVEQLKGNAQPVPVKPAQPPAHNALNSEQRTAVAICSLLFGIPLVAISGAYGFAFFALVVLMVLGINFAVNWRR